MKHHKKVLPTAIVILSMTAPMAYAGGAVNHSGQSVQHSAAAAGHLSVGVAKTAAGVISVPFEVVGKAGEISGQAGGDLREFANQPLPIGDEIITVGPSPDEML